MSRTRFQQRVKISGCLVFGTAFHIGSGKEGDLATDMGVLRDYQGQPILPGSSLKGKFRAMAEQMASYLGMSACLLDTELSGVDCVGDQKYFRNMNEDFKKATTEKKKIAWLTQHSCDVCRLFGSPLQAGRIFFSDGILTRWPGGYQVRDGVVIDRDSETARDRLKFDYEVAAADTIFDIVIDLENPDDRELALIGAVLAEWQSGFRLGGFTSRGLGNVVLSETRVEHVDYTNPAHLKEYLLHRTMQTADSLPAQKLEQVLAGLAEHREKEATSC